jgi:hypothetical protein
MSHPEAYSVKAYTPIGRLKCRNLMAPHKKPTLHFSKFAAFPHLPNYFLVRLLVLKVWEEKIIEISFEQKNALPCDAALLERDVHGN